MYQMRVTEYSRWLSIKNPAQRLWVRTWIDSLHAGTHIHWQLSPLTILGLAHLWPYIKRQADGFTKRQRIGIKAMAGRRQADPGYLGSMPAFDEADSTWDTFFDRQVTCRDQIRNSLFEWHLTALDTTRDVALSFRYMTALSAALLLRGHSTDQLFRGIYQGVLNPEFNAGTPAANLRAWLESNVSPSPTEFFAYTKLVPLQSVSVTLRSKWSNLKLPNVDAFEDPRTLPVLIGDSLDPYIVTRRAVVGGIGELHRREAQRLYSLRVQRFPALAAFVLPPLSHFRSVEPESVEQLHDVGFKRLELSVSASGDEEGAILYQKAAHDLFDAPEEAIRNLMVGAELRWRRRTAKETDNVLGNAYRWNLRNRLGKDFAAFLQRARSLAKSSSVPMGAALEEMAAWDWKDEMGFLLERLVRIKDIDDELAVVRLREITDWYSAQPCPMSELSGYANTWQEIDDLLAIVRGIRNSATHFAPADEELYGIMLHLAKVLFEAFASAWVRDATNRSPN